MLRAQILRHQRHTCTVATVARHHHELPDARVRHVLAERRPCLQGHIGGQCQRARIIEVFGGNADRLLRQENCRDVGRQQLAHPRQIGFADHDVGTKRQMRAMLLGRCQRQHRDPARSLVAGEIGPVNVGPVAGRNNGCHRATCFLG
jgi:hypothetical protein